MDDTYDLREVREAEVRPVPWFFRLGRYLAKRSIRGGNRIVSQARRLGLLDQFAQYRVGDVELRVPLWRPCNEWDADDVLTYEAPFIESFGGAIRQMQGRVTLLDCGADIGTVSALLVAHCGNITRLVAFEPNPTAYNVLQTNVMAMPIRALARYAAVGSYSGRGELVRDPLDASAHAMYIVPNPNGPIDVEQLDSLGLPPGEPCAIKIDVEGAEPSVIAGAMMLIRHASEVVVSFEAHPRVLRRTGEDPIQIMRALRQIRPNFTFSVDLLPEVELTLERPLFEQVPADRVYNVIACSLH
jgi:FkbM family methyltransferase